MKHNLYLAGMLAVFFFILAASSTCTRRKTMDGAVSPNWRQNSDIVYEILKNDADSQGAFQDKAEIFQCISKVTVYYMDLSGCEYVAVSTYTDFINHANICINDKFMDAMKAEVMDCVVKQSADHSNMLTGYYR